MRLGVKYALLMAVCTAINPFFSKMEVARNVGLLLALVSSIMPVLRFVVIESKYLLSATMEICLMEMVARQTVQFNLDSFAK